MNSKKWSVFLALLLSFAMVLVGCSGSTNAGGDPQQLTLATGGTSGTYYALGSGISKILTDKAKLNTNNQSTGASVENMRLLSNGEVQIAFTQSDILNYATNGTEMFKTQGAIKNLKALANLYPETVQIVVPANSSVKTVQDLKGKRVSVGAGGSGTELNAKQILEVHGIKFEDLQVQRLSFGDSVAAIKDGKLDAAFVTAGTPTAAVTELGATNGVRILNVEDEFFQKLSQKYPFYTQVTIPGNTYKGQDTDVKTVAIQAMLVVSDEMSEEMVYNITKSLFDNLETLGTIHAKGKEVKLENALKGFSEEVHPGAMKYFNEKGVTK
ncbi:TAXI family TRAP transporter solute-binding subunit [Risungbinella massiliensis]|uniref:TAXI family TRAP transporter solute-binding subunit n=1 Tax=Risungbinella massiliensis TaxID=1329796 RepID=UPI0009E5D4D2|nr:TAXI family TRAP transporter solute-binding subunit [Risungbinella massiliensis]